MPQYVGHYWGAGGACMVWWLHSFYKLQQWAAFRPIVVVRLGQCFSPSLLSHCWDWTSIIISLCNYRTILFYDVMILQQIILLQTELCLL